MAHKRKYDSVDKLLLLVAGAAITGMQAMQTHYSSNIEKNSRDTALIATKNLAEMVGVKEKMARIEDNQEKQQQSIGNIEKQVVKLCERQKMRYPNSGECE